MPPPVGSWSNYIFLTGRKQARKHANKLRKKATKKATNGRKEGRKEGEDRGGEGEDKGRGRGRQGEGKGKGRGRKGEDKGKGRGRQGEGIDEEDEEDEEEEEEEEEVVVVVVVEVEVEVEVEEETLAKKHWHCNNSFYTPGMCLWTSRLLETWPSNCGSGIQRCRSLELTHNPTMDLVALQRIFAGNAFRTLRSAKRENRSHQAARGKKVEDPRIVPLIHCRVRFISIV